MLGRRIICLFALIATLTGCSPDYVKPGVYVEVHGEILLDGAPVRDANVVFVPEQIGIDEAFAISTGTTNAFGEFELSSANGTEGALVGKHRVYISRIQDSPPNKNWKPPVATSPDGTEIGERASEVEDPGLVWELVARSVEQPDGEEIPFYYNLKSELTYRVIPGRGIQRPVFELSSVDPMLQSNE